MNSKMLIGAVLMFGSAWMLTTGLSAIESLAFIFTLILGCIAFLQEL